MPLIFKRARDQGKRRACFFIDYVDHKGNRWRKKGFADKEKTTRLAAAIERTVWLRKRGLL